MVFKYDKNINNDFDKIINNYVRTICTSFNAEKNTFTEGNFINICDLPNLMKDLMTTIFKNTTNDIVISKLLELDTENYIVKKFNKTGIIDYNEVKIAKNKQKLENLENITKDYEPLEKLQKKLEAYQVIDDEENIKCISDKLKNLRDVEVIKNTIDHLKTLDPDIHTILQPVSYFSFSDLIKDGRLDILGLYIDSFREFNKQDVLDALPHNENKYKYLCAVKKLFPNVKADSVHIVANAFAEFIQKIYFNLGITDYNPQKMLYLYSMLGGTGKGVFMRRLEHFCNTYKIPVNPNANISSHWLTAEFQLNVISIIPEFFPYKSNMNEQIININNIIDNGQYTIELKGQQPYSAKSNTALICGSNKKPFDINDRRYNIVEYNNFQLFDQDVVEEYKDVLHTEYTPEEWDAIFYDAFTSCPFNFKFKPIYNIKYISENYIDFVEDIRSLKDVNSALFLEPVTIREIAAALQQANDGKHIKALQKEYKRSILKNIVGLIKDNLIQPAVKVNGMIEYSKYDLNKICDLKICSDLIEETKDLNNPIYETAQAWDTLIKQYKPTNNDPNGGKDVKTENVKPVRTLIEKVEPVEPVKQTNNMTADEMINEVASIKEKLIEVEPYTEKNIVCADLDAMNVDDLDLRKFDITVCDDKYSKPSNYVNENTQFLLTARFKLEYKEQLMKEDSLKNLNRRAKNMLPVFFVYEMDDVDKETQFNIAEKLYKNNVWTVTDSGNKSIHTLVYIDPSQAEDVAKDFKYYWNIVAKKLYGKVAEYLDPACASIGRLTRFPDGKRDNGKIQYCIFKNENVKPIDLSEDIKNHSVELKNKENFNTINMLLKSCNNNNNYDNDPDTIEHLKRAVAKSGNEAGKIAVDLVEGVDPGPGANYIGAIGYCKTAIGPKTAKIVQDIAHKLHPTNIGKSC